MNDAADEQLALLRHWWERWGRLLVVVLVTVAIVGVVFGLWQSQQRTTKERAALYFYELLEAVEQVDEGDVAAARSVEYLCRELQQQYPRSNYAAFAGLFLAKFAVRRGDLEAARDALERLQAHPLPSILKELVQLRLARVIAAQGNPEQALAILPVTGVNALSLLEARGDLYQAMGRFEEALAIYRQARERTPAEEDATVLLAIKIQTLRTRLGESTPPTTQDVSTGVSFPGQPDGAPLEAQPAATPAAFSPPAGDVPPQQPDRDKLEAAQPGAGSDVSPPSDLPRP